MEYGYKKIIDGKLEEAEKSGLLPKILVPVHLAGQPCDMVAIYELSKKYGILIYFFSQKFHFKIV